MARKAGRTELGRRSVIRVRALIRDRLDLLRLLLCLGWLGVVALAAAMLALTVLPAATALAVGAVVGRVIELAGTDEGVSAAAGPLALLGALLVADQVAGSLLTPIRNYAASRVNGHVRSLVREAVSARPGIDHLEDQVVRDAARLPIDDVYIANMGAAAEGQLWLMARFVGAGASAAIIAAYSVPLAVFAFAAMALQRAVLRRHYAKPMTRTVDASVNSTRAAQYWGDVVASQLGGKELRLFGFRDWAVEQFAVFARDRVDKSEAVIASAFPKHALIFVMSTVGALVPFVVLVNGAVDGDLSIPRLAATLSAVLALASLGGMGWEAYSIEVAVPQLAALRQLQALHREEVGPLRLHRPAHATRTAELARPTTTSDVPLIRFEHLTFRYPGTDHDVLHELSLDLRPGESVAIVGENGVGKTTLLKLLARFYAPDRGRILIDGADLQELDPVAWRRRLAVIFQEFVHFELSALDNVALADLDQADVMANARLAADNAGALEMIEALPAGWQTVLSRAYTDGTDLSGGQWQRVALARAMYAARVGGTVLVLDEPTASLDVAAEISLFDQLLEHALGSTAIIVSHRYSTVRRASRIVVLGNGRVIEDGNHDELMARDGAYARLYRLQASKFLAEQPDTSDDADLTS